MPILWLPICTILELIKRPIFWVLYPFAYMRRKQCREIFNWPTDDLLWLALDDVIHNESVNDYGQDVEFCWFCKRSSFVEKYLPYDFCRSWYWGAFRNSSINLMNLTEKWIGQKTAVISRKQWGKSFYELRQFEHARLPYLEVWIGGWRWQCGFISAGRFQQQIRKLI